MSFTYNLNIPDGPHNPSADQPLMKVNTNSINSWTGVDHVDFAGIGGQGAGQHLQVTFFDENVPVAPTDPTSILYTTVGGASSVAEMYYQNANAILPVSAIKAFGVFTANFAGVVSTFGNSFNCVSISSVASSTTYTITLKPNVVTGNNILVLATSSTSGNPTVAWNFTNPVLNIFNNGTGNQISFVVLQF